MRGVAGRRKHLEAGDLAAEHVHVGGRDGNDRTEEAVELVPIESPGASLEPARVDEMRRADLAHVHLEPRVAADERAGPTGVVGMDVGEEQVMDVTEAQAVLGETGLERVDAHGGTAIDERVPAARQADSSR